MNYRFLPMLAVLLTGTACYKAAPQRQRPYVAPTPQPTLNSKLYDLSVPANVLTLRSNFLSQINELRKPYGKPDLVWNDKLNEMAENWAQVHKDKGLYMTHEYNGSIPETRANQVSYGYFNIAENICRSFQPDGKMIFVIWRNSEKHRKNMLGPATEMGLGCILSDYGVVDTPKYVCVAVFGRPAP